MFVLGSFTVGSVGAKHLLPQLSAHGMHDQAMRVATQDTFPSFGYWLKLGATTCWENYSGKADPSHPPPPTHNHIFLCGGVGEWLYRQVAGVGPAADGYARIAIAPQVTLDPAANGPSSANATIHSVRGTVSVQWSLSRGAGATITMAVGVPVSATATVAIPAAELQITPLDKLTVKESGKLVWADGKFVPGVQGVMAAQIDGGGVVLAVTSGKYLFEAA